MQNKKETSRILNDILNFKLENYNEDTTKVPDPGFYYSKVENIESNVNFENKLTVKISYQLTSVSSPNEDSPDVLDFHETFVWDYQNRRTKNFVDYLKTEHQIVPTNVLSFVGREEVVQIEMVEKYSHLFHNIVKRYSLASAKAGGII